MENQNNWIKVIESEKNSVKENAIMSYLQWNFRKEVLVDLPCYTSPAVQKDFWKKIYEVCSQLMQQLSTENIEIVKIYAPLMDNPNAPGDCGNTPIYLAACNGHTEIVKILAPLIANPNAPDKDGGTPIHMAAYYGHTEIVKILAPLTDNPNAPTNNGKTPISVATNAEIIRFLQSFNTFHK